MSKISCQKRENIQTARFNSRAQISMRYLESQKDLVAISKQGRFTLKSAPSRSLEDDLQ